MSRGMDAERYARVSAAAEAQLAAYAETAERLAGVPAEARSKDGRVMVRAVAGGHVAGLRLSDDVLARYTVGALGDVVTRTIREAQRRAEAALERGVGEVELPALAEADQIMAELAVEGKITHELAMPDEE